MYFYKVYWKSSCAWLSTLICVCAARVADLLFVQGTEVIFKVALCLLSSHEGEILECDGFESIVDYLKSTIPTLTHSQMEEIITKVNIIL